MHRLTPNTTYRIHTLAIAVPDGVPECDLADSISEMMNNAMQCSDAVFHDWQYDPANVAEVNTGDDVEEGEVFRF